MKILLIQTASIGDVVLMTPMVEALHHTLPGVQIDLLVKKGMEPLFKDHPYLQQVLIWDKSNRKYSNLFRLMQRVRQEKYDQVITLQRFFSGGLIAVLSGAKVKAGFDKNPLSRWFTYRLPHVINNPSVHEADRNISLLAHLGVSPPWKPRLHLSESVIKRVMSSVRQPYLCIAPASLWFTKQYPEEQWIDLMDNIPQHYTCYVIGSKSDKPLAERLCNKTTHPAVIDLTGKHTLMETAALMKHAVMNYTNDSAPLHLASATNAPVTAIFCSTVPAFGFGPLSDHSFVVETPRPLPCRPCGIHGKRACPEKHFHCARFIQTKHLIASLPQSSI